MMASEPIPVEIAAAILLPHFDAVRDVYVEGPIHGPRLERARRVRLIVDPSIRDAARHYMACRDDGLVILAAPEAVTLPVPILVAIMTHEFGHAIDFLYPARWWFRGRDRRATWLDEDDARLGRHLRLWQNRNRDQVEWSADAIAWAVTGQQVRYAGRCMLQTLDGYGVLRPEGLR